MVLNDKQLKEAVVQILVKKGTAQADAETVAHDLVTADMMGMNSHGVLRVTQYLNDIDAGLLSPENTVRVVKETPSTVVVDGGFTYGQVVAHRMVELLTEKAKQVGIACALGVSSRHMGRIGGYVEELARRGLVALALTGVYDVNAMAPFGGMDTRLSTNPISWAVPTADGDPMFMDIATTMVAEGKLRAYALDGKDVPIGWIKDANGNDTTNPADLYGPPRGSIYPLGGRLGGAKGSGLAIMTNMFSMALNNEEYWSEFQQGRKPRSENSMFLMAVNPEFFCGLEAYEKQVAAHRAYLKSSRPEPGRSEVLMPGEFEHNNLKKSRENGTYIPDNTWDNLVALGKQLGCDFSKDMTGGEELRNAFQF